MNAATNINDYYRVLSHEMAHQKVYQAVNGWGRDEALHGCDITMLLHDSGIYSGSFNYYRRSVECYHEYEGMELDANDLVILAGTYHEMVMRELDGFESLEEAESHNWLIGHLTEDDVVAMIYRLLEEAHEDEGCDNKKFLRSIGCLYHDAEELGWEIFSLCEERDECECPDRRAELNDRINELSEYEREAMIGGVDVDYVVDCFRCVSEILNSDTPYWSIPVNFELADN